MGGGKGSVVVIFSLLLVHHECVAFLPCVLFTHDGLNSDTERQSKSSSCLPTLPPQVLTSRFLILLFRHFKVESVAAERELPPFPVMKRFHQLPPFPLVLPSDVNSRCPSRDLHISGPPQFRLVEAGRQGSVITQTLCSTHLPASRCRCRQMSSLSLPWNRLFRARLFSQLPVLDSHAYSF